MDRNRSHDRSLGYLCFIIVKLKYHECVAANGGHFEGALWAARLKNKHRRIKKVTIVSRILCFAKVHILRLCIIVWLLSWCLWMTNCGPPWASFLTWLPVLQSYWQTECKCKCGCRLVGSRVALPLLPKTFHHHTTHIAPPRPRPVEHTANLQPIG